MTEFIDAAKTQLFAEMIERADALFRDSPEYAGPDELFMEFRETLTRRMGPAAGDPRALFREWLEYYRGHIGLNGDQGRALMVAITEAARLAPGSASACPGCGAKLYGPSDFKAHADHIREAASRRPPAAPLIAPPVPALPEGGAIWGDWPPTERNIPAAR